MKDRIIDNFILETPELYGALSFLIGHHNYKVDEKRIDEDGDYIIRLHKKNGFAGFIIDANDRIIYWFANVKNGDSIWTYGGHIDEENIADERSRMGDFLALVNKL